VGEERADKKKKRRKERDKEWRGDRRSEFSLLVSFPTFLYTSSIPSILNPSLPLFLLSPFSLSLSLSLSSLYTSPSIPSSLNPNFSNTFLITL
jgi:hypothetical protein